MFFNKSVESKKFVEKHSGGGLSTISSIRRSYHRITLNILVKFLITINYAFEKYQIKVRLAKQ